MTVCDVCSDEILSTQDTIYHIQKHQAQMVLLTNKLHTDDLNQDVSSMGAAHKVFKCPRQCRKAVFDKSSGLIRHFATHVAVNENCFCCGKIFDKAVKFLAHRCPEAANQEGLLSEQQDRIRDMISVELGLKKGRRRGKGRKIEVQATQQRTSSQQIATDTLAIPHAPVLPDAFHIPDTGIAIAQMRPSALPQWPGGAVYTPLYYQGSAPNRPWSEIGNNV